MQKRSVKRAYVCDTHLLHSPFCDDDDAVSVLDGAEPVCDHERRPVLHQPVQRFLDHRLRSQGRGQGEKLGINRLNRNGNSDMKL